MITIVLRPGCGDNQNSRTREGSVCQPSSGTIRRPVLGHKDVTSQRQRRFERRF